MPSHAPCRSAGSAALPKRKLDFCIPTSEQSRHSKPPHSHFCTHPKKNYPPSHSFPLSHAIQNLVSLAQLPVKRCGTHSPSLISSKVGLMPRASLCLVAPMFLIVFARSPWPRTPPPAPSTAPSSIPPERISPRLPSSPSTPPPAFVTPPHLTPKAASRFDLLPPGDYTARAVADKMSPQETPLLHVDVGAARETRIPSHHRGPAGKSSPSPALPNWSTPIPAPFPLSSTSAPSPIFRSTAAAFPI